MRTDEEQTQDMIAALKEAREVLRIIASNRRRHGAISTKALATSHMINNVLNDQVEGTTAPNGLQIVEKITFTANGEIRRGNVRVGQIDHRALKAGVRWKVRLNEASGAPGVVGDYPLLREAKAAAVAALT